MKKVKLFPVGGRYSVQKVLDKMVIESNKGHEFVDVDGHPVWTRKQQYKKFRKSFYKKNQCKLKCAICGVEADHFRLTKCKGDGANHFDEETQTIIRKFTFKLYDKFGNVFTLDHWIPNWLLKKLGIKLTNNLVPMCDPCNNLKGQMLPEHFQGQKTPKRWRKAYATA